MNYLSFLIQLVNGPYTWLLAIDTFFEKEITTKQWWQPKERKAKQMDNLCANWNNQNKQVHVVKWKRKIELTNTKIM
jgi:hypothetical protein